MPFQYRLQKFLEIRIRKKEEQLEVVQKCQKEVMRIEGLIEANNQNIKDTRINMRKSDPRMYDGFDKFLKHLYEEGEKLEQQRQEALKVLRREEEILMQREREVDVLEKHKEHKKEEYLYEEKMRELKTLNEIGSQKHFMRKREAEYEQEIEEMLQRHKEK
jgi:flagellar export protein FliJ